MYQELKTLNVPNTKRDQLLLSKITFYAPGYEKKDVYELGYLSYEPVNGEDVFACCNSEYFNTRPEAEDAMNRRLASSNPYQAVSFEPGQYIHWPSRLNLRLSRVAA